VLGRRWVLLVGFLIFMPLSHADQLIKAVRIWPSPVYTRIVIESPAPIVHHLFTLQSPLRIVLDLHDVRLQGPLERLSEAIHADNPDIAAIRVARFNPDTVRVVMVLKHPVEPVLANLAPVSDYGYRLILDIYPKLPIDAIARFALPQASKPRFQTHINSPVSHKTLLSHEIIVAVDPGHGGEDPGAHGVNGTLEKNVTLAIGRKLQRAIDAIPGMHAELTRTGDYYVPLQMRVLEAHEMHADLFVSIHADSQPGGHNVQGSTVYALSEHGATSVAARLLAKSENESDQIGGVTLPVQDPVLARTLLDLSQTATINDSLEMGADVLSELDKFHSLHNARVEQAGFAVLKSPDIPSILVETAYISNPIEEARLNNPAFQEQVAEAIAHGLYDYVHSNPSFDRILAGR